MKLRSSTGVSGNRTEPYKTQDGTKSRNTSRRRRKRGQSSRSQPARQPVALQPEYDNLDPYVYRPLCLSKKEIRLVTVLSGEHGSPIQIILHHVSLNPPPPQTLPAVMSLKDVRATLTRGWEAHQSIRGRILFYGPGGPGGTEVATWVHPNSHISQTAYDITMHPPPSREGVPDFEALSYAWGTLDLTATIVAYENFEGPISPQPLPVIQSEPRVLRIGENLHEALLHLRLPDEPRVMWIDALCINQDDLEERGHQVKQMARIYSSARKVVAWIGPEHDDALKAIEWLARLGSQVEIVGDSYLSPTPGASEPLWHKSDVSIPSDNIIRAAISSLVDRPWFWRLWVVQEIHMGHLNSSLRCGAHEVTWLHFRQAIFCLTSKLTPLLNVSQTMRLRGMCQRTFGRGFEDRLRILGSENRCSDPRDIIYGLLSLAPPELQKAICVDYKADVKSVYRAFFTAYSALQLRSDLLMSSMCSTTTVGNAPQLWPSWVPDWRESWRRMAFQNRTFVSAAGQSRAEMILNFGSDDQLRVQGIIIDTVSSIHIENCGDLSTAIQTLREIANQIASQATAKEGGELRIGSVDSYIDAFHQGRTSDRILWSTEWAAPSAKQFLQEVLQNQSFLLDSEETRPSWWATYRGSTAPYFPGSKLFATGTGRAASSKSEIQLGKCLASFVNTMDR